MTYYAQKKQPQKSQPKRSKLGSTVVGIALAAAVFFGSVGVCLNTDKPKVAEDFQSAATEVVQHKHGPLMALTLLRHFEPALEARSLETPQHYKLENGILTGKSADGGVTVEMTGVNIGRDGFYRPLIFQNRKDERFSYKDRNGEITASSVSGIRIFSEDRRGTYDGYDTSTQFSCEYLTRRHDYSYNPCKANISLFANGVEYNRGDIVDYMHFMDQRLKPSYWENTLAQIDGLPRKMSKDIEDLLAGTGYRAKEGVISSWALNVVTGTREKGFYGNYVLFHSFEKKNVGGVLETTERSQYAEPRVYRTEVSRAADAIVQREFVNGIEVTSFYLYDNGRRKLVRQAQNKGVNFMETIYWGGFDAQPKTVFTAKDPSKGKSLTIYGQDGELSLSWLNYYADKVVKNGILSGLRVASIN